MAEKCDEIERDHDRARLTDDCLRLLDVFVRVRDRKSRAQIIKFAQRFSFFDDIGMLHFNSLEQPTKGDEGDPPSHSDHCDGREARS